MAVFSIYDGPGLRYVYSWSVKLVLLATLKGADVMYSLKPTLGPKKLRGGQDWSAELRIEGPVAV
eukprot:5327978-Amphidinium_carterae.1